MPCCAFVACIVGQLIVGFVGVKRALFGGAPSGGAPENAAVLWRLDSAAVPLPAPVSGIGGPSGVRRLALVAAVEAALILGAVYGVIEHLGHDVEEGHAAHVHAGHVHAAVTGAATR